MIDVLLATYRPQEAMLKAQVESIRAQTGVEVNLIRREDNSAVALDNRRKLVVGNDYGSL